MGARVHVDLSAKARELRLPLTHIKRFVSTLRRPGVHWDEDTRREFLAQLEHEADRLAEMVDELMERSTTGRRPRHVRPRSRRVH